MKRLLLSTMMVLFAVMAMAQEKTTFTWTAEKMGWDNAEAVESFYVAEDLTAEAAKNDGNNPPAYYDGDKSLRFYASNTLTLKGPGISKVAFTFAANRKSISTNVGTLSNDVWTGQADEIVFTVPTGQARIVSMEITYQGTGEVVENEEERVIDDVLVELPEGVETEEWALEGYFVIDEDTYDKVANNLQFGFKGQDVYIQGLSYYLPEAWVKATLSADGKTITIPSPQYYGALEYDGSSYPCYLLLNRYDGEQNIDEYPEAVTFNFDKENGTIEVPEDIFLVENAKPVRDFYGYGYYSGITIHKGAPVVPELVELPEGVKTAEYHFAAYDTYFKKNVEYAVQVAFDNTDVYFLGLSPTVPEAWVKGTLANGVVTLPENQYMGMYESYFGDMDIFFGGATFTYDAEKATFTSEEGYVTTYNDYPYDEFANVVIAKVVEKVATPATPSILKLDYDDEYGYMVYPNVPLVGTEGDYLLSTKLSYQLYVDKNGEVEPYVLKTSDYERLSEDMTIIPYTFTDDWDVEPNAYLVYIYGDVPSWSKIGIKSIYTGGGETRESAIGWYEVDTKYTGVQHLTQNAKAVVYYDMQGRQTAASAKGLVIRQEQMEDGSVRNVKVVRK
jgi:hypothetical protein